MHNDAIDPETLAAFLDGTLPPAERERVLATLAQSDEGYEQLLEASALLAETRESGAAGDLPAPAVPSAGATVTPLRQVRRRRTWMIAAPTLLAAGIAALVVLPRVRAGRGAAALELSRGLAAGLGARGATSAFGADWETPAWSATRGAEVRLATSARATRSGVHYVDLELAGSLRDSAAFVSAARALAELVASADGGTALASQLDSTNLHIGKPRDGLAAELRHFDGAPAWFDLGVWTETARLAARAGRAEFFADGGAARRELRRILDAVGDVDAASSAGDAMRRLRGIADARPPTREQLPALAAALEQVIALAAR